LNFFLHIFKKYSNIKFHENPSSGSRVVSYGWADTHIHNEAASCSFINVHENEWQPLVMIIFHHNFYIQLTEMWKREKVPS